ncbi:gamma-glutamyltransferase family protein [Succiniclasticum ruminis]|uniref:Gamma-glutamyltranspeptidase / glutathione hydrolase n=1 Tax=Succiniclasticum ruminis DSM 9236 TaxID=1123323 RepID=A0A1I1XFL9_9FIRM|nr:gamma-glutamyltransferase family protein [Succiniclasticum ruminis]SFE06189.1 gamma-glutamyltranspeptidase / glutathione hydrolase [Succiniclasticum ruminis DSM 9236]
MASYISFDGASNKYPSRRSVVYGKNGMVCTSQALAAQAGLDVLKRGGNAVDAAIATAISLTVLEPPSNGIGSDLFALVWYKGKLYGLNGSGPSPMALTREKVLGKLGTYDRAKDNYADSGEILDLSSSDMPDHGWETVTIPGAPASWKALHERFGAAEFGSLFEAAISYAEEGFPLQPVCSKLWKKNAPKVSGLKNEIMYLPMLETFFNNKELDPGSVVKLPEMGKTLRRLAESRCNSFYTGDIAREIIRFSCETGGYLTEEDLHNYRPEWVEPIRLNYRGCDVCEIPPNGHGLVVLMTLNILRHVSLAEKDNPETVHKQLEAMKIGFTDGKMYIADPRYMKANVDYFLSKEYGKKRAGEIRTEAHLPRPVDLNCGGTVYLCTADKEGNMVSLIQSHFNNFGSKLSVPGTGILLNNRGKNFSLDPEHDNCLAPGKKPYHTIIPGFLMKDGEPVGPFGVMGAFMQPQGQVQVVNNLVDFGLNPQEALDAPRWQWTGGKTVEVEASFDQTMVENLKQRGHDIKVMEEFTSFGRGQIIVRQPDGVYAAATEPRADGVVAAW